MNPKIIKLFNKKDNIMKNFDKNDVNTTFSNVANTVEFSTNSGNQETSTREIIFHSFGDCYPWNQFLDPNYLRGYTSETSEEVTPSEASPEEAPAVTVQAEDETAPSEEVQPDLANAEQVEEEDAPKKKSKKKEPKTELPPYEIFTQEKMKAALRPFYEMGSEKPGDSFLNGAVAFYAPASIMTLDELKVQIGCPDKASKKIEGWHAMHYCLACLTGEELMQYVQKAKDTYSNSDWEALNKPARGSVGLLHALAMNVDHESALKAFNELKATGCMTWSNTGGLLGLLPTHVAVINGANKLAEAMTPICSGADGTELLTCFPVSSQILKKILTDGSDITIRMLQLRSTKGAQECSRDLRRKGLNGMWDSEIREGKYLQKALTKMTFRTDTVLKEATKESRLSSQWLNGLLSTMKPVAFTWTSLHCEVMDAMCKREHLEANAERNRTLLGCKDAHGRSPLFYALACGSEDAIRWCLDNAIANEVQECDAHQRSLLAALAMNPNCEQMLSLVERIISEESIREDIFGISPVVYAMLCGKNELAKRIYELTNELYLVSPSRQKAMGKLFKRAAASLENQEMQEYLDKNEATSCRQEWAAHGCFY